jgi:subtilisin-like proprotein convertase family protein
MSFRSLLRLPVRVQRPAAAKPSRKSNLQVELLERREVMTAEQWQIGANVYNLTQTFALHSNPASKNVVYLDFDGHTNGDVYGSSWDNIVSPAWDGSGNGATFTDFEKQTIQRVWSRVAEDFAPFNVDVTTQDPGVEGLRKTGGTDDRWGIRVVITPSDQPAPGAGGVAYVGSFNFNTDTPAYVFNGTEKAIAEAASHEAGHALGLGHDGTGSLGYYSGHGSGATSWGPIMGASYSPIVTQWSKGQYSGANNAEDDLAKITSQNGFGYRSDDYGNAQSTAAALLAQGATQVAPLYGIVERNTDSDWFSFWSGAGAISLKADPLALGPNLAVRADLYNSSGTLVTTVNPAAALNAVVNFSLPTAGQYFLKISGAGKGDPLTNGFSNYGSLGNYRITGTVQAYTGGGTTNAAPVANPDTATTVARVPVTVNVLANDTDANGDALTITAVTSAQNGTAAISNGAVVFTPVAGFTGTASFTYSISDGKGGTASGVATVTVNPGSTTQTFTNNADVTISSTSTSTVTSSIAVAGLTGTLQDVDVKVNIYHTYDSDLQITLIAPDGTRVVLFNRHGGGSNNLLGTTFDDAAATAVANGAAPFTGTFRPTQLLSALNGKSPNGAWRLEVRDFDRRDGGRIDNWSLVLKTSPQAANSASSAAVAPSATNNSSANRAAFDALADVFTNLSCGSDAGAAWRALAGRSAATLQVYYRSLSDAQVQSLYEELFGAEREGDLPLYR